MKHLRSINRFVCMLFLLSMIAGCAGGPGYEMDSGDSNISRIDGATLELVRGEKTLENAGFFKNISIEPFEVSEELQTEYAYQLDTFQNALIFHLKEKNRFDTISKIEKGAVETQKADSFKIEGKILDMRITSPAARFWGGALAGSSYMDVYLRFVDSKNGNIIHEKIIATHNSAVAASWTGGSSDQSLPQDMAEIVGEYIATVIPSK